jgi:hypothetical protein
MVSADVKTARGKKKMRKRGRSRPRFRRLHFAAVNAAQERMKFMEEFVI